MIEFFGGIGGMRSAIESLTKVQLEACMAYEISEKANKVYRHNFPDKEGDATKKNLFSVRTKLVEQLKVKDLLLASSSSSSSLLLSSSPPPSEEHFNLWTMSPPCQPFTRTRLAKQRDLSDNRTAGFVAILHLLKAMEQTSRPQWIFLENVEGFVGSQAHKLFYETLLQCGYSWTSGVLSPVDMGIPNHRKRYFALCEKSDRFFPRDESSIDNCPDGKDSLKSSLHLGDFPAQNLSAYVSHDIDTTNLTIPDSVFTKDWAKDLPVVSHLDTQSHCFTAAYSRQLHRATGSLLLMEPDRTESVEKCPIDRSDITQYRGKLRRFAVPELLKLFGFDEFFSFPSDVDQSYQYKLVGNSVNVFVIRVLLEHLLSPSSASSSGPQRET